MLTRIFLRTGESMMISYCGRRILCHPKLQLFLSSPSDRLNATKVLASMSTLVNFSSDREALTERLVKVCLARLRPDMWKEKRLILKNIHTLKELLSHVIDYTQKDMKKSSRGKIWNEDDVKVLSEGMKIKHEVGCLKVRTDFIVCI